MAMPQEYTNRYGRDRGLADPQGLPGTFRDTDEDYTNFSGIFRLCGNKYTRSRNAVSASGERVWICVSLKRKFTEHFEDAAINTHV